MDKKKFFAVSLCAALLLSGCRNQTTVENEWSESWGNSGGNILEGGYIATNGETICYTDLNGTNDFLYELDETGEPILLSNKLAYDLNMINDRVYFVSGLPGPICSIRTDGTSYTTLVRGEYRNLFVSQTHMAYMQGSNLVVSDITGGNAAVIATHVRRFLPFQGAFMFTTADGLYRVNPDGTGLECLFDEQPVCLCANSTGIYFSVSNDASSFGKAGGRVYCMDEEGTISQLPIEYECWNMNASDDYLFFRNQSDKGALYRMDLDGGNACCLLAANCSDVNIIGNSVVFRVITKGNGVEAGYYIIEQDGSNLRLFDSRTIPSCGIYDIFQQQLIDDTHDAFLVNTGGKLGTLLVTAELAEEIKSEFGTRDITFSVWNPMEMEQPIQTFSEEFMMGVAPEFHHVVDANFDGFQDFGYLFHVGNQPNYWRYWLWDEEQAQFIYYAPLIEISSPGFDADRQIVTGWARSSAVSGTHTFYRWVDGELTLVRKRYHDFTKMIVVEDLIDGQMVEVYREEWNGEKDENDVLDELYKWNNLDYHGEPTEED